MRLRAAHHRRPGRGPLVAAGLRPGDSEVRFLAWAGSLLDRYGVFTREVVAAWRPRPRPGGSWRRSSRGRNGGARFAAAISSRASPAFNSPPRRGRRARPARGPPGPARRSSSSRRPTRPISTVPVPRWTSSSSTADPPGCRGSAGHFLVLRDGRPVLIIESYGKRLTGLASASPADIDSALNLLSSLTGPVNGESSRWKRIMGSPPRRVRSPAGWPRLGFVRDYPGMAYYATWARLDPSCALIVGPQARPWRRPVRRCTRSRAMETSRINRPRRRQPEFDCIVISDLHLGSDVCQAKLLEEFLDLGGQPLPRAGHQRRYLRRPELQAI